MPAEFLITAKALRYQKGLSVSLRIRRRLARQRDGKAAAGWGLWLGTGSRLRGARGSTCVPRGAKSRDHKPWSRSCAGTSVPHLSLCSCFSAHPCPSPGDMVDPCSPKITAFSLAKSSCKLASENGEEGLPRQGAVGAGKRAKRSWGAGGPSGLRQLRPLLCPRLTPRFCYLPNLASRAAPLICPFQRPWFMLPDKQGPSSCQVSLSQSLCK